MLRRRRLGRIVSLLLVCCCPAVMAQELEGWQSDSFSAHSIIAKPDEQQVYKVLLKMLDRWNAHDIEAYMGGLLEVS
jgi:hypothetical protein